MNDNGNRIVDVFSHFFPWKKYTNGFVVEDKFGALSEIREKPPFLMTKMESEAERYNVFDIVDLWEHFVSLRFNQDVILKDFANARGFLGNPLGVIGFIKGDRNLTSMYLYEPLDLWKKEITDARFADLLSDLIEDNEERILRKCISWENGTVIKWQPLTREVLGKYIGEEGYFCLESEYNLMPLYITNNRIIGLFSNNDLLGPAKIFLGQIVNSKLKELEVQPKMYITPEGGLKPYLAPQSLIGAIWLEFFHIINGLSHREQCQFCDDWDIVGKGHLIKGKGHHFGKFHHKRCFARYRQRKRRMKLKMKQEEDFHFNKGD